MYHDLFHMNLTFSRCSSAFPCRNNSASFNELHDLGANHHLILCPLSMPNIRNNKPQCFSMNIMSSPKKLVTPYPDRLMSLHQLFGESHTTQRSPNVFLQMSPFLDHDQNIRTETKSMFDCCSCPLVSIMTGISALKQRTCLTEQQSKFDGDHLMMGETVSISLMWTTDNSTLPQCHFSCTLFVEERLYYAVVMYYIQLTC